MVQSRSSDNGYTCFVARTDIYALPQHVEYRDDFLVPICFDRLGSQEIVPGFLYAEEMRVSGMSAADLVENLKTKISAATKPGLSSMISPILRSYTPSGDVENINIPHYMYYAPNAGAEDLGPIPFSPTHPFLINTNVYGAKHTLMIQFVGAAEKAAINAEYKDMLTALCDARADGAYCMDIDTINAGLRDQLTSALQNLPPTQN